MFDIGDEKLDMMQLMNKYPILIVGTKKDLVDHNKAGYLLISTKVQNHLKVVSSKFGRKDDLSSIVQYTESGLYSNMIDTNGDGVLDTF